MLSALVMSGIVITVYCALDSNTKLAQILLAIAGSILASAAFSFWMMLSRFTEAASVFAREAARDDLVSAKLETLANEVARYRRSASLLSEAKRGLVVPFVLTQQPRDHLARLMHVPDTHPLNIYFVGINLRSIYEEHLKQLRGRADTYLRVALPHPEGTSLAAACKREGRNLKQIQKSIREVTGFLGDEINFPQCELRWLREAPPLTIVQIENTILWRPRLLNEQDEGEHFCALLTEEDQPDLFRIVQREFRSCWESGEAPPL